MCLILVALNQRSDLPLVLAANRDEYFARPTRAAGYWEDAPGVLGGRDLEAGGSWLGVDTGGRLAAVTNVREPPLRKTGLESRGRLVSDYLKTTTSPADYLQEVIRRRQRFDGYNLLVGSTTELLYHASRDARYLRLEGGVHGISNGALDCSWPKVNRGKAALRRCLEDDAALDPERLFELLADTGVPEDETLPDTGVGLEMERQLAPIFVRMDGYGTRCSTLIVLEAGGRLRFYERVFSEDGGIVETGRFEFEIE